MARRIKVSTDAGEPSASEEQSASGEREKEISRLQNDAVERTRARVEPPGGSSSNVAPMASPEDVGEPVSATWGEEFYTPQQFFTFRIGPFSRQSKIRAGETAVTAKARLTAEMAQMAVDERKQKMTIFLDTMAELFDAVKKRQAVKS